MGSWKLLGCAAIIIYGCVCGANGKLHDTHGRHNHDIPIWKDEDLLLDYANFWAPHNRALRDYIANCASDDAIRNFRICLTSSRNRIINTRQPEDAARILHNLQVVFTCHFSITWQTNYCCYIAAQIWILMLLSIIDHARQDHACEFKWNLKLFHSPPKIQRDALQVDAEELAEVEKLLNVSSTTT